MVVADVLEGIRDRLDEVFWRMIVMALGLRNDMGQNPRPDGPGGILPPAAARSLAWRCKSVPEIAVLFAGVSPTASARSDGEGPHGASAFGQIKAGFNHRGPAGQLQAI